VHGSERQDDPARCEPFDIQTLEILLSPAGSRLLSILDVCGGRHVCVEVLRADERVCAEYSPLAPSRHALARGQIRKGHHIISPL
jgi:hypothetical protein